MFKKTSWLTLKKDFILPTNLERILKVAGEEFKNVKLLSSDEWPMPKEMSLHIELLDELAKTNIISFTKKFGLMTYYTDIYVATN